MTLQLTLVEIGRLRRHPALWGSVAGAVALLVWQDRQEPLMPNAARDTLAAATVVFVVAATLMVVANLATVRDQHSDMPETLAALPGRAAERTRAVAAATAATGAGLAALIIGTYVLVRMTTGPVAGVFDVYELLAAVMGVAALAALGVTLGRWLPTPIAVPTFLVVLALYNMMSAILIPGLWILPLTEAFAGHALAAPSPLRLLYLSIVVVFAVTLALLRHRCTLLCVGTMMATLAVLVPLALALPKSASSAVAEQLECTERNEVTYCHLPGFAAWVPLWAKAVEPVFNALPSDVRDRFPTIRQHGSPVPLAAVQYTSDGHVGESWGRGELQTQDEISLAGKVAARLTGFDAGPVFPAYDARGQARTVIALWLAGHAGHVPEADERDVWGATHLGSVEYGDDERRYAKALLDDPNARARIGRHWDTLTDPATTIEQAAPLLGVSPPLPAVGWLAAESYR
jgi:hypothetical protein